jgi:hypothetical protein
MRQDATDYITAIKKELADKGIQVQEGHTVYGADEYQGSENVPDLVIDTADGKKVLVEVKDAKSYGKLPLSTALEMKSLKDIHPETFIYLVSLSEISRTLSESLKNIGINYLVKLTAKEAAKKIISSYSMPV